MNTLPPFNVLVTLPVEEIASFLLQELNSKVENKEQNLFSMYNLLSPSNQYIHQYAGHYTAEASNILSEAWSHLVSRGYLAKSAEQAHGSFYFITKLGRSIKSKSDMDKRKYQQMLPTENIDQELLEKVAGDFIKAEFDSAVMKAYKLVEIRIRSAAYLSNLS